MSTYRILFDAEGNEVDPDVSTSTTVNPASIAGITYQDVTNTRRTLDEHRDPARSLQFARQAEVDDLARRTRVAEDFALELIDPATNLPIKGAEQVFAKRMAVAESLRDATFYAHQHGSAAVEAAQGQPSDTVRKLQEEYDQQQAAAEAARLADVAKRAAR